MPEVCEVTLITQYLSSFKNRIITKIDLLAGKYKNDLNNKELVDGSQIMDINSKGKFIWFELKKNNEIIYIMIWLLLNGTLSDKSKPTNHIIFHTDDFNKKIYFTDGYPYGIIQITNDVQILNKKLNTLAPDVLKDVYDFNILYNTFLKKKTKNKLIVELLLEQDVCKGIVSGIGNYMVAEILYRAHISPHRIINTLSQEEINTLGDVIKIVVKQCYISNNSSYINEHDEYKNYVSDHLGLVNSNVLPNYHPYVTDITTSLKPFEFMVYKQKYDPNGCIVKKEKIVSTRTTHWVSEVQI